MKRIARLNAVILVFCCSYLTQNVVGDTAFDNVVVSNSFRQVGASDTNSFAGRVGMGTTTPAAPLSFGTGAGEKIRIYDSDSSGSYGMGLAGGDIQIYSGSGGDITFRDGGYNSSVRLRVKSGGNVGIGTDSPSQRLHVYGNGLIESNLAVKSSLVVGTGTATAPGSVSEGSSTTASGNNSHAEGSSTAVSSVAGHAEGSGTSVYSGGSAHGEGDYTVASGSASHAEGEQTAASGAYSHSEGVISTATGYSSHAAGCSAHAIHNYSYVWSDGTTYLSSTTNNQYSIYAANGTRILGGPTVIVRGGDISQGIFTNMP